MDRRLLEDLAVEKLSGWEAPESRRSWLRPCCCEGKLAHDLKLSALPERRVDSCEESKQSSSSSTALK